MRYSTVTALPSSTSSRDPSSNFACWVCYSPDCANLRWDKHRRPYIACDACGFRGFVKSPRHLRGIGMTNALVEACIAQAERDPAARDAHNARADAFVSAVQSRIELVAGATNGDTSPQEMDHVGPVSISAARK